MNTIKLFLLLTISIVFISSCSEKEKTNSPQKQNETKTPSLTMKFLAKYQFDKNDSVLIIKLIPTSNQSGNQSTRAPVNLYN